MPLETATYIAGLDPSNPASSDGLNQADDHMRLIKLALKNTFPNINSAVSLTPEQLNALFASQFLGPDGTALLPAWSFASQPAMGIRRSAAGLMEIVGGTLRGNGAIPAGFLGDFGAATAPPGWYACDGQTIAVASDPDLFAAIGYTWGGAGASFVLPNALSGGRFRRHRDNSTFSGIVGTYQNCSNQSHTHGVSITTGTESVAHAHAFSGTTAGVNRNGSHSHTSSFQYGPFAGGTASLVLQPTGAANGSGFTSQAGDVTNTDHEHSYGGVTATQNAAHTHAVNGNTGGGTADSSEARPYALTVLTCIKR